MSKTQSKLGVTIPNDYLVYTALLTQVEEAAPDPIVLKNTLGGIVVWSYSAPGVYFATLVGAFPTGKVWVIINQSDDITFESTIQRVGDDDVKVNTYISNVLQDNVLTDTSIEIRVYP